MIRETQFCILKKGDEIRTSDGQIWLVRDARDVCGKRVVTIQLSGSDLVVELFWEAPIGIVGIHHNPLDTFNHADAGMVDETVEWVLAEMEDCMKEHVRRLDEATKRQARAAARKGMETAMGV